MLAKSIEVLVPARSQSVHKHRAGHVGILAGSRGKTGAAALAATAALRAGAGVVTIGTWADAALVLEARVVEAMVFPLDAADAEESTLAFAADKRSLVVGPGFGLDDASWRALLAVLRAHEGPLVLDADALTLLSGRLDALVASRARAVLTPHAGEAARLLGTSSAEIERDRPRAARAIAARSGAVTVLKGAHSIVAAPSGLIRVSPVACPALAIAGSGDVLAGALGALLCDLDVWDAASVGVLAHGLAGMRHGRDRGLIASELAVALGEVLSPSPSDHALRPHGHGALHADTRIR